jgi:hypothetical protein
MELLAQREPDARVTATIAAPTPAPPIPTDFVQRDWGMAIGICALVLVNLWQLVKSQMSADNDLQKELIKSLLDERKILLQAVLERKTGS